MKKLITILTSLSLISGTSCAVVACNSKITNNKKADFIQPHETMLNPSKKKASKITPAEKKAHKLTPSSPKATTIKPSNPITGNAASIGHKIENRTIALHGSFWLGKDIFNYRQQLADAIVEQGLLTRSEVKYISWGHLLITENKLYHNINFTVKTYDATYVASLIKFFVNESPQDIVNKLNQQTIKLDPNFWMNKNLQDYQNKMNAIVVQDKLLTKYETQYVHWNAFHVNQAKYYWNKASFAVWKRMAQYGATGKVTINASVGETTKVIANKLKNAKITFNYDYWHGKNVANYLPLVRSILVNEKILTKTEASVVEGFLHPRIINNAGKLAVNFNVNDGNTNTYAYTNINVLNDGASAKSLVNSINNKSFGLKTNTKGMYADSSYVMNNFRNLASAVYNAKMNSARLTLPHVKLVNDNANIKATINKDGQIATAKVDLQCKTGSYIYYHYYNTSVTSSVNDLVFYVNFTPAMKNTIKSIFWHHSIMQNLGIFYNALDDGEVHDEFMPSYSGASYIPWANRLDQNLDDFGSQGDPQENIVRETTNDLPAIHNFANALFKKVIYSDGYTSLMVHWHYPTDEYNTISDYHFW